MTDSDQNQDPQGDGREARILIEDSNGRRPFMRGIMVHSLMARGVSFEEAVKTADLVKERTQARGVVPRAELAKHVGEILSTDVLGDHQPPIPIPGSIIVGGPDDSNPFSKGLLAQSLLAASVDPSDAFDVAREIEIDLLRQGRRQISRHELRRLAYEKMLRRFGPRAASRFLIWRQFQEPEKPVIILLGGSSGVGKTSLALEVARRLGISRVLSTDSIRQVMRLMLSPELMPAIHASSFDAHRHNAAGAAAPSDGEEDAVVNGFLAQAQIVSVGVRGMIERAIDESTSMILDGVSLVPGMIDLNAYAEKAHIIYLVVARMDEGSFRNHFIARGKREAHRDAVRYVDNLEGILKIQEQFLELADHLDIPIVDNVTIDGSVMLVIRHVVETLRKSGNFDEVDRL
ncbi:MAG: 2-phosphoglycerate kinase [Myxococcota bacterium]|jgi:2-phosphoglycerate kinase